jgi:ABC-type branched-subunit amino acid transport system ATPase component/ABC-type branched-subunit amino acid transport system permease subunit
MVLAFVPAIVVGLAVLLNRTPLGIAIRASSENSDLAELRGMSARRVSIFVWVLTGCLATITVVMVNPLRGTIVGLAAPALGPGLMIRALAAALVGGLVSLPLTLVGGIGIGMAEAVLFTKFTNPGVVDGVIFLAILVLVLLRARPGEQRETGAWSLSATERPIPRRLKAIPWVRWMPQLAGGAGLLVLVIVPFVFTHPSTTFLLAHVFVFAIVGLSVTVLTGWAGQLSLGQFAFVGLGAFIAAALHRQGLPFAIAVVLATLSGSIAALVIGFPALRIKGVYLAITTLAFAVGARSWIFTESFLTGSSTVASIPRGSVLGVDLASQRAYYFLLMGCLVVCLLIASALRRSVVGRSIIATRDNERAAQSLGVSPPVAKLTAFAVSGAFAALAGALLAGLRVQFQAGDFGPEQSLQVIAMTIIGGLGSVPGAVLGAINVVGIPSLLHFSARLTLVIGGFGLLTLLLFLPGGQIEMVRRMRDRVLVLAERRLPPPDPAAAPPPPTSIAVRSRPGRVRAVTSATAPVLRASDVTVRFGGRLALEGVGVEVSDGEVVGLIGANGAGKTTLMNVISGFVPPVSGRVEVFQRDIAGLSPARRAHLGIGRVFQDARLFPTLTVRESIQVGLEAPGGGGPLSSLLVPWPRGASRATDSEVDEYLAFLNLGRYEDTLVAELSTGIRRVAELACVLSLGPRLLLLDEPTAGLAQREGEGFATLVKKVQTELGASVLIIEHDVSLIMSVSDRVYCLAAGRNISCGTPAEVQHDPAVIAAYLGTDDSLEELSRELVGVEQTPTTSA